MNVTLIGSGCGAGTLTREAAEAVEKADLVIGAGRLLKEQSGSFEAVERVRPGEILEILQRKKPENACVLLHILPSRFAVRVSFFPVTRVSIPGRRNCSGFFRRTGSARA